MFCITLRTTKLNAHFFQSYTAIATKSRSRADAILQRARSQTAAASRISQSPVSLAKSWGTPIWTPEHALKFLDKVKSCIKLAQPLIGGGKPANLKHLRGDYIKIQPFDRQYRPYYKEIKSWPVIQLITGGDSPFRIRGDDDSTPATTAAASKKPEPYKMTRKSRSKHMRTKVNDLKRSSDKQCGYCEICRVEYDILSTHLQTKEHLNFVKNDDNFLALDTLITNSANMASFLKANEALAKDDIDSGFFGKRSGRKVSKLIRPCNIDIKKECDSTAGQINAFTLNGRLAHLQHKYSPPMTRRSNGRNKSEPISPIAALAAPLPPSEPKSKSPAKSSPIKMEMDDDNSMDYNDDNDMTASLPRSRRESARRINYAEIKEDEENTDDSKDEQLKKIEKIRLRGIRWRPPSLDDQSSITQPIVYKVVKDKPSTKLLPKSSNGGNRKEPLSEQNKSSGIKVRICRVRESELSRLTNEADKFMFPRIFSEPLTDDDRHSSSDWAPADESTDLQTSSEVNRSRSGGRLLMSPPLMAASSGEVHRPTAVKRKMKKTKYGCSGGGAKKRGRPLSSSASSDYTKIERDSRLGFQAAPVQSSITVDKPRTITSPSGCRPAYGTEDRTGEYVIKQSSNQMKKCDYGNLWPTHRFAFERVPDNESWYGAFQRQDECCEEIFQYWGNTGEFKGMIVI